MTELSPEAEAIAQGVEAREAELDAMEADPDMVGSDAWQEAQRDAQADADEADMNDPGWTDEIPESECDQNRTWERDADYDEEPF